MTRKKASRSNDTVERYLIYLAEEEPKGDIGTGKRGRPVTPRRRALDRVADAMGYTGWRSVESVVRRWEATRTADIETWGLELDPAFSAAVRALQDAADTMLEAVDLLIEGCEGELREYIAPLRDMREGIAACRPSVLCVFCKGTDGDCAHCDGDGWFDATPVNVDPRLLDKSVPHVERCGEVVPLFGEEG